MEQNWGFALMAICVRRKENTVMNWDFMGQPVLVAKLVVPQQGENKWHYRKHVRMSLFWFLDHSFVCSYHSNSGPCNSTQTWPVSFGSEMTCCFNDKDNYLLSRTRLSWIALCFGMLNMRTTEFHWLYFDYIWTATVLIKREEQLPQKLSEKTVSGLSSVCRPKDGNSRPSDKRSPVGETFNLITRKPDVIWKRGRHKNKNVQFVCLE